MIILQIDEMKIDLKKILSEYRYGHSLRVAGVAKELATIYRADENKAYIAGLVHDVAKEFTDEENIRWLENSNMDVNLLDTKFKSVIHAEIGALVARQRYEVSEDICQAIRYHTIGNINMTLFDKIIFVADKIEEGKDYPGIEEEREMAFKNIDQAMLLCLRNKKKKFDTKGKVLHPESLRLLEHLEKNFFE